MSFLRRISRLQPEPRVDRIARNLGRIFNSRKEYGSVVRGFGLGDYEKTWNSPALFDTLMAEIVAAVRDFEPDLTEPRIRLDGRDRQLWVRFVLAGLVDGEEQEFYIDIDSKYRNVVVEPCP